MTQDQKLAQQIITEGTWEQALAAAQADTIARNIARWKLEQEQKAKKRQQDLAAAAKKGLTLRGLKELRREEWRKRNCRATISEIVQQHSK